MADKPMHFAKRLHHVYLKTRPLERRRHGGGRTDADIRSDMPKAKRTIRLAILVVAACLAGFITLRAVTPLEPRAQHTVRLCVDRPPVATKLFRSQQFLSGGEVVAVFTHTDFGLDSVSSARLASVEDDKVAVRYFAVRVENQGGDQLARRGRGERRGGRGFSERARCTRFGLRARAAPDGGCWSLACTLTLKCRRKATGVAWGRCDHEDSTELPASGPGCCDGASHFPPVNRVTSPLSCTRTPAPPYPGRSSPTPGAWLTFSYFEPPGREPARGRDLRAQLLSRVSRAGRQAPNALPGRRHRRCGFRPERQHEPAESRHRPASDGNGRERQAQVGRITNTRGVAEFPLSSVYARAARGGVSPDTQKEADASVDRLASAMRAMARSAPPEWVRAA